MNRQNASQKLGRHLLFGACLILSVWGLSSRSYGQTPILFYNFGAGTGTTAVSTGSSAASATMANSSGTAANLYTASGTGVTGAAGDYALNLNATGMGNAGTGGVLALSGTTAVNGLSSFTLSGWFNTESLTTEISNGARLFDFTNGSNGFLLDAGSSAGQLALSVNGSTAGTTSASSYASKDSWVFFAVTYDGTSTTNNVNFYEGSLTSAPTLVLTASSSLGAVATTTAVMGIGGNQSYARSFQGDLDDIAIYGSTSTGSGALTSAQLNSLYVQEVPEPSTIALSLIGGASILLWARRLRTERSA